MIRSLVPKTRNDAAYWRFRPYFFGRLGRKCRPPCICRGKSSGCYQLESTFHSQTSKRSLRVGGHLPFVHVWGQGSEEPHSPQKTRLILDKQSRTVDICCSIVSEQTCSRTGEKTHECVSEFFSWRATLSRDMRLIQPRMWTWSFQERPSLMTSSTSNHNSKSRQFPKRYLMQ